MSRGKKIVIGVLALMVVLTGAGLWTVSWALGGAAGSGKPVNVVVPEGASAAQVASQLDSKGVIRSAIAFRLKARSRDLDRTLTAGTYELETGMSVDETLAAFAAGPQAPEVMRFTLPEGLTVEQTVTSLASQTPHSVDEYRQVLEQRTVEVPDWTPALDGFGDQVRQPYEGLLFPETYELRLEAGPGQVLQRLADQLGQVYADIVGGSPPSSTPPSPTSTPATPTSPVSPAPSVGSASRSNQAVAADYDRYQKLVVASLVEEEARIADERPVIAGVIYNRLARGMRLQIDAANIYAVGEHTEEVTQEYLEVDSPYNLYETAGLPPTPISAPGRASIEAAFNPAEHAFLYYVKIDEDGTHAFAETLQEHNRNKQRAGELLEQQATESP